MRRATRRKMLVRIRTTHPSAVDVASPTLGVLRLVSPASEEGTFLSGARVAPVTRGISAIGRAQHNAIVLLDPSVSREHARLFASSEGWHIENCSTTSPIEVSGQTLGAGERAPLSPGDVVRLGQTAMQLVAPRLQDFGPDFNPASSPDPYAAYLAGTPGESTDLLPDEVTAADLADGQSGALTPPYSAASSINLLSPGITLQFALQGHFNTRLRWILGIGAALLLLICTVVTLGTAVLVGRGALATEGAGSVLAALTIPLVPALGVALVVMALDRYEREPWSLLLGAFLWGALIAIAPALFLERRLTGLLANALASAGLPGGLVHAASQAVSAGFSEEAIKGIGLVLLLVLLRDEFDNVTDGILYGALIGAGFAMVENFVYFAVAPRADLGVLIFGRVILGWLSHSTFTAFFGAGLGFARETRNRRWQRRAPLLGFAVALLLHTGFDFVAFGADALATPELLVRAGALFALVTLVAEYVPLFTAQAMLLRIALSSLAREAETIREYLVGEVLDGVISPEEYLLLQNATLRDAAERAYALEYGLAAWLTARTLYQTMTGLAFRTWHVTMGDPPKATPRQPEEVYRARIARLRRSLRRQVSFRLSVHPLPDGPREAEPTRPLRQQ
ncbi:MAG TPA: PrsW family glutamic-type intramembrane protease [Ktedonobacterales bacterium]|nr:PrsW family glutamic-type intramembrane protease [Ktedonobacterales bacterium]